ncbi:hypothetical protein SAMN05661093_06691 [Kibdelosporangium aridum]|uniref:Uncharacterized protein n=1 Tax=Kibdelosporangium aridum TaxID=2030 RepID=A0A1W2FHH5_KIBAR|nr:hypothetical protein SAMN05661093_06691 [Kibdelosporangium aridum]
MTFAQAASGPQHQPTSNHRQPRAGEHPHPQPIHRRTAEAPHSVRAVLRAASGPPNTSLRPTTDNLGWAKIHTRNPSTGRPPRHRTLRVTFVQATSGPGLQRTGDYRQSRLGEDAHRRPVHRQTTEAPHSAHALSQAASGPTNISLRPTTDNPGRAKIHIAHLVHRQTTKTPNLARAPVRGLRPPTQAPSNQRQPQAGEHPHSATVHKRTTEAPHSAHALSQAASGPTNTSLRPTTDNPGRAKIHIAHLSTGNPLRHRAPPSPWLPVDGPPGSPV